MSFLEWYHTETTFDRRKNTHRTVLTCFEKILIKPSESAKFYINYMVFIQAESLFATFIVKSVGK